MLRMQKCLLCWSSILMRLVFLSLRCDARTVNVSNTWTMPQEDINVFYRFFRDRISWFEADAVCQFHHANLVTVDNSFQFDATRDLLRELDVNDIVWIGLLRPQNSERFMWSNSRPFVTETGYWAEALPLMDAPLCAVIDPIRDYRWHALRCGGPETASFLCEMPVPAWADVCLIKDMPNLTMQYMADTASIELIRNCQQEGLLRQTCKGKADRDRAMVELICPKERLAAQQRNNDMTNSHFKSLHIINSIRTDNNERNEIELLPNYGVGGARGALHTTNGHVQQPNTVQQLIEQFSVGDLMMQSDKSALDCAYAKSTLAPRMANKNTKEEEMMMGDQPMAEGEHVPEESKLLHEAEAVVNNEIFELLPHRKRILAQDLKAMPDGKGVENSDAQMDDTLTNFTISSETMNTTASTTATLMTLRTTTIDDKLKTTKQSTDEASTTTTTTTTTTNRQIALTHSDDSIVVVNDDDDRNVSTIHELSSTLSPITIGHAMHPTQQQQHQPTPHSKESNFDTSHFIPPMLLVKSHYVPLVKHEHKHNAEAEFNEHHHNKQLNQQRDTKPILLTTTTVDANVGDAISETSEAPSPPHNLLENKNTATTTAATTTTNANGLNKNTFTAATLGTDITNSAVLATTTDATTLRRYLPIDESTTNETILTTTATETSSIELQTFASANLAMDGIRTQPLTTTMKIETLAATSETTATISSDHFTTRTTTATAKASTTERSFLLDALTEAQYKPNRRRSLTKPETQSYFKKILG